MRFLFFLILAAGIGNTVLRPEIESPFTLYRILAPLGLLAVFALAPGLAFKLGAGFIAFAAYNFILASLYSSDYSQFLPSIVHYLYIFIILAMMMYLRQRDREFELAFLRFIEWFYVFLLLNLMVEFMFGSYYPNLYQDDSEDGSLRAFFWNQNDLAVVLCMIAWIVLCLSRYGMAVRLIVVSITLAVLFLNDSKAALLSFVGITLPVLAFRRIVTSVKIPSAVWVLTGGLAVGLLIALVLVLQDVEIRFANDTYSVRSLLIDPIEGILTLSPSGEDLGSIANRTDAAIFVIIEYLRSYGLGLGAGGSWLVLSRPGYQLGGAESPHNALLQFTVDFGYPVLLGYLYATGWALRRLFRRHLEEAEKLKVVGVLSFPLLGLSQSGAIVTNYFFWAAAFFIWMYGRPAAGAAIGSTQEQLASSASGSDAAGDLVRPQC